MTPSLLFNFTVDRSNNSIVVEREFAARVNLVWDAWTRPELLDQWWAPKPYQTKTKLMDFRNGGHWLYAMLSPTGEAHWCRADYEQIIDGKQFAALDAFCDEQGVINADFPRSFWTNTFHETEEHTRVHITISYNRLEDLEKIISMGFREGFSAALQNLDQYIEAQFRLRNEMNTERMPRASTYLNFDGKTEEAFLFYQSVFKTAFIGRGLQRFGDIPQNSAHPPVADNIKNMILHVELPITGNHILMGTDAPKEMGFTLTAGNNMHINLEPGSRAEAERLFQALSEGGEVTMPLTDMFFGAYYGSLTDRYGINWMIHHHNQ